MADCSQDGLAWDLDGVDPEPKWTRKPSIEAIEMVCRQHLHVDSNDTCHISFYDEGAFNKLYLVKTGEQSLLIRITLPVCPYHKTNGEVTTLQWLAENTSIPVPKVIAFDDSSDNEIRFEWILMELMPGVSLYRRWRSLSPLQKVILTQRIAEFQAELFRHNFPRASFRGLGSLERAPGEAKPTPGQLVSAEFFVGDHIKYDGVPRGPFRSSHDWLKSCLDIVIRDLGNTASKDEDEERREDATADLDIAQRLLSLLPKIFPSIQQPAERTVLLHDDLGLANILVDDQGHITAVLDWECVSTMPLWMATQVPRFLRTDTREEEPRRDAYQRVPEPAEDGSQTDPDELDNEGVNELYWIHLMEYEATQLQKIYHDKMRSLWPDWDLQRDESRLQLEFYNAAMRCAYGRIDGNTESWLEKIEKETSSADADGTECSLEVIEPDTK